MPSINVSLKDGASADKLEAAKKQITDKGGKITHEYTLVKGFSADIPDDQVSVLKSDDHINVENDGQVKTQ